MFGRYPRRSLLGFTLMSTQAFIYNATVFTFTAGLVTCYGVSSETAPLYLVPFAIANFLGALLLGRFFDTIGRRAMIASTYFISAVGLVVAGVLFKKTRSRSASSWRSCARPSSSLPQPRRPAT